MKILITLLLFPLASIVSGQTNCACCDELHKQFDFWVGNWVVKDTLGNKVGESKISKN